MGILRQELDSLIRVSYLWHEDTAIKEGIKLIQDTVEGRQWKKLTTKGKEIRITDREMVELARHLGGWENTIYDFGCKLIHLSNFHSYKSSDPFSNLPEKEKVDIIGYLENYHNYPHSNLSLDLLKPYLPKVMTKLKENIDFYLEEIPQKYVSSTNKVRLCERSEPQSTVCWTSPWEVLRVALYRKYLFQACLP